MSFPEFIQIAAQGGQYCALCGEFIPSGTIHDCNRNEEREPDNLDQHLLPGSWETWQCIAVALERIALALEKED